MNGIGVETSKNLILAGPQKVVIYDENKASLPDLGSNFYLNEEHCTQNVCYLNTNRVFINISITKYLHDPDLQLNRADACLASLSTLNPYVDVSVHHGQLDEAFLSSFHVVAVTLPLPLQELIRINEISRSKDIKVLQLPLPSPSPSPSPSHCGPVYLCQ